MLDYSDDFREIKMFFEENIGLLDGGSYQAKKNFTIELLERHQILLQTGLYEDLELQMPLLAMLSIVHIKAPDVMEDLAVSSATVKSAKKILESYPYEQVKFLQKHFLDVIIIS